MRKTIGVHIDIEATIHPNVSSQAAVNVGHCKLEYPLHLEDPYRLGGEEFPGNENAVAHHGSPWW